MRTYLVYQQQRPVAHKTGRVDENGREVTEFMPRLEYIGSISAYSGAAAIEGAREQFQEFRRASRKTLAAFPVVQEIAE